MKRGKDEGKMVEPMFPRLHVKDREIGGPRAPPRNKMALYEQLSIPSHRFNSSSASASASASAPPPKDQGNQRRNFTPSQLDGPPHPPSHSVKNVHSQSLDSRSLNFPSTTFGRTSKRLSNNSACNANQSASGLHRQLYSSAYSRKSSGKNIEDEDDFMVPTFVQSSIAPFPGQHKNLSTTEPKRPSPSINDMMSKDTEQNHIQKDCPDLYPEYCRNGSPDEARCHQGIDVVGIDYDNPRSRRELCFEVSVLANKQSGERERDANVSPEFKDTDRNGVHEEISIPVSKLGTGISPDDVVGVIGPRHFWKARRAIANQQRIFAAQVFELHRLIKVQKLLAASPDVVKVDFYLNLSHSLPEEMPVEDIQTEDAEKPHQQTVVLEETQSKRPKQSEESPEVNYTLREPPSNEILCRQVQAPAAPDISSNPPFFHPQLNQWLVPVMSPSEGLIYKPYSGPCPPTAGFMAPFYGDTAPPLSFPLVPVDIMNPVCGVLPYQQQPPFYFPMMNQIISSFATKQVTLCNPTNPEREVVSVHFQKCEASKDSEVQGSTLMGPSVKENASLPSFCGSRCSDDTNQPMETSESDSRSRVIRVVPRNARLASESVARIFRSIQEERKQYVA